jgi:hypothetical protein
MPLCTTTIRPEPSRCGWAFSSVGERLRLDRVLEINQLAGAAALLDAAIGDDGDPGRVVAAILQPAKPFQ